MIQRFYLKTFNVVVSCGTVNGTNIIPSDVTRQIERFINISCNYLMIGMSNIFMMRQFNVRPHTKQNQADKKAQRLRRCDACSQMRDRTRRPRAALTMPTASAQAMQCTKRLSFASGFYRHWGKQNKKCFKLVLGDWPYSTQALTCLDLCFVLKGT